MWGTSLKVVNLSGDPFQSPSSFRGLISFSRTGFSNLLPRGYNAGYHLGPAQEKDVNNFTIN